MSNNISLLTVCFHMMSEVPVPGAPLLCTHSIDLCPNPNLKVKVVVTLLVSCVQLIKCATDEFSQVYRA